MELDPTAFTNVWLLFDALSSSLLSKGNMLELQNFDERYYLVTQFGYKVLLIEILFAELFLLFIVLVVVVAVVVLMVAVVVKSLLSKVEHSS